MFQALGLVCSPSSVLKTTTCDIQQRGDCLPPSNVELKGLPAFKGAHFSRYHHHHHHYYYYSKSWDSHLPAP